MQLELIEKLDDDGLVEIHVARLLTGAGPRLVTARRFKRQAAGVAGLSDRLAQAAGEMSGLEHPAILQPLGLFSAGQDLWWLSERTLGFDLGTVLARLQTREVRSTPIRSANCSPSPITFPSCAASSSSSRNVNTCGPRTALAKQKGTVFRYITCCTPRPHTCTQLRKKRNSA